MQHWIVDKEAVALSSWQEAIPRAVILRRDQVLSGFSETPGVYWCRLRIGEALDDVMPPKVLRAGQLVVVLADEPDESVVSDALAAGASGWSLRMVVCGSGSHCCRSWLAAHRVCLVSAHRDRIRKVVCHYSPRERLRSPGWWPVVQVIRK